MRFHVINLPHTQATKKYNCCAFTQNVINFCKMMHSLNHTIYFYGGEGSEVDCTEHITIVTNEERQLWFGHNDWSKDFFDIKFDANMPYWVKSNSTAIQEISKRIEPGDIICLIGGNCHKVIADSFPQNKSVEFAIGYEGVFAKYRVYPSYAWMHYIHGWLHQDGSPNETIIPHYFDTDEFPFSEEKEDYYFFIGRMIQRKGFNLAVEACQKNNSKLIMAGQGVVNKFPGKIIGKDFVINGNNIEHLGPVSVEERGKLMSKAKAVLVPTQYIGPFESVHIEAMFCGTPVITTDWGAFTETIINGFNGYRIKTANEMVEAMNKIGELNPKKIREYAIENFSLNSVRYKYEKYFEYLMKI